MDDSVDEPVGDGLIGREIAVALHVGVDPLHGLARVLGIDLVDSGPQRQYLAGVDLDIGRLPLEAAGRLVDQDPAVRSAIRLPGAPPASSSEPIDIAIP